jgi:hypothetical protein
MQASAAIGTAVVCFGFYLLLAGQISSDEAIVGAVLGVSASAFAVALSHASDRRFAFRWAEARLLLGASLKAPLATARVGAGFARELVGGGDRSLVRRVPFRHGRLADPRENARRAARILAGSLAPDSFVFRMDPHEADVREHALEPPPRVGDAR